MSELADNILNLCVFVSIQVFQWTQLRQLIVYKCLFHLNGISLIAEIIYMRMGACQKGSENLENSFNADQQDLSPQIAEVRPGIGLSTLKTPNSLQQTKINMMSTGCSFNYKQTKIKSNRIVIDTNNNENKTDQARSSIKIELNTKLLLQSSKVDAIISKNPQQTFEKSQQLKQDSNYIKKKTFSVIYEQEIVLEGESLIKKVHSKFRRPN